ncbi:hypothetical protein Tsp_11663 [Trichinella spiralis]|uniref:hypothetical protein n=1 Tax=Trichinella spiralis TaxID=6334 RepID=UPI0001EFE339|nr:hypothetical protein Tsp_11663 [Trichinella spiralis]
MLYCVVVVDMQASERTKNDRFSKCFTKDEVADSVTTINLMKFFYRKIDPFSFRLRHSFCSIRTDSAAYDLRQRPVFCSVKVVSRASELDSLLAKPNKFQIILNGTIVNNNICGGTKTKNNFKRAKQTNFILPR